MKVPTARRKTTFLRRLNLRARTRSKTRETTIATIGGAKTTITGHEDTEAKMIETGIPTGIETAIEGTIETRKSQTSLAAAM